ncbi:MAG TPA: DUF6232 family protein [Pilimelia sp.]|nr:DUF6232 family protein [Pilimelia sp.]
MLTRRLPAPLYSQPGIEVTDEWFTVGGFPYPVYELSNLRTARGLRHPFTIRAMVVTTVVLLGIAATLGLLGNPAQLPGGTYLAIASAFIAPFLFAAIGERIWPRSWELWADYYGITVRLFLTDSEQQYGQVTRALLRAKEIARLGAAAELRDLEPWLSWRRMAVRR